MFHPGKAGVTPPAKNPKPKSGVQGERMDLPNLYQLPKHPPVKPGRKIVVLLTAQLQDKSSGNGLPPSKKQIATPEPPARPH